MGRERGRENKLALKKKRMGLCSLSEGVRNAKQFDESVAEIKSKARTYLTDPADRKCWAAWRRSCAVSRTTLSVCSSTTAPLIRISPLKS